LTTRQSLWRFFSVLIELATFIFGALVYGGCETKRGT
jgi:hypothetical protein